MPFMHLLCILEVSLLQIQRLGTFCHWKRINKKSSHREMHFVTINTYSSVSIPKKCKVAQQYRNGF